MSPEFPLPKHVLLWRAIANKIIHAIMNSQGLYESKGDECATEITTEHPENHTDIISDLLKYSDINVTSFELTEKMDELTKYVQENRRRLVDVQKQTTELRKDMEQRLAKQAEIRDLTDNFKELIKIVLDLPWKTPPKPHDGHRGESQSAGAGNSAQTPKILDIFKTALANLTVDSEDIGPDINLSMERISAQLKELAGNRTVFETKLSSLRAEAKENYDALQSTTRPRPFRPVDITYEDISVTVGQIVNESFPMIKSKIEDVHAFIQEDSSAAENLFRSLEMPLRTINLLMKRFKISGASFGTHNPGDSSSMHY